jgi:hypothetical protein
MANNQNRKAFTGNRKRKSTAVLEPAGVMIYLPQPIVDNEKKPTTAYKNETVDPGLVQRYRVAVLGIKRSLICGAIVMAGLITLYLILK